MELLWKRLKERKLVQWALAYAAGAWLVLQFLSLVAQPFAWPPAVLRAATVLCIAGLFAVLVLAWYHGEKGQQKATGVELLMLAGILAIAATAVSFVARKRPAPTASALAPAADTLAPQSSIAVLPFVDMSPAKDQEYLGDGIAEQLINALTQIDGLSVPARTSAFSFKGKNENIRQIAQDLSVAHVLEGSVIKSGDRVRITAQLINAKDGYHLWSQTFDRDMNDIFAVQDEIVKEIVSGLEVKLGKTDQPSIAEHATADPRAYELFLNGTFQWNKRSAESIPLAVDYFKRATALDPNFALAYAMLAQAYILMPEYSDKKWADLEPVARASAQKALALDSTLAQAHVALGWIVGRRDPERGIRYYRRALALNPRDPTAHHWFAVLLRRLGRSSEAVEEAKRAVALDPLSLGTNGQLAFALYTGRRFEESIAQARHVIELDPGWGYGYWDVALCRLAQGRYAEAAPWFGRWAARATLDSARVANTVSLVGHAVRNSTNAALRLRARRAVDTLSRASLVLATSLYAELGEGDRAFAALEQFIDEQGVWMTFEPAFDKLRNDARYAALARRSGILL